VPGEPSGLQFPPNTEGQYRNCDPLTLEFILYQTFKKHGEDCFSLPQRVLLDSNWNPKNGLGNGPLRKHVLHRQQLHNGSQLGKARAPLSTRRAARRKTLMRSNPPAVLSKRKVGSCAYRVRAGSLCLGPSSHPAPRMSPSRAI